MKDWGKEMQADFLKNFKFSIYGESHADSIGGIIDSVPAGMEINQERIEKLLLERNPDFPFNTKRKDSSKIIFESGINKDNNKIITNGSPICFKILNDDVKKNYNKFEFRLGHADFSSFSKYGNNYPYSGGGPFSGRITAIIVVVGEIAQQILQKIDGSLFEVYTAITEVGKIKTKSLFDLTNEELKMIDSKFPVIGTQRRADILELLNNLDNDSLGGKIEIRIKNMKYNLGGLYFNSLESILSSACFSVPGVKGISFGAGDDFIKKYASELHEKVDISNNNLKITSNINGGINGGISNGVQDICFSCIIKPPMSLAREQEIIKFKNNCYSKEEKKISGRHDKFIVNKAIYPIKGWIYICLLDLILENKKWM